MTVLVILQIIKTAFLVVLLMKTTVYKFIQSTISEHSYCRSVMKKHFNKNLVITVDEEEEFERNNSCWICGKLIDIDDNKVSDHCHITGKYRGSCH